MLEEGYADESTIFICNHFSHNGIHVVYDEFVPIAEKEGFLVSYDGMVVTI
jgi:phosphoribosyl 1,2-cyclic phosphate phosphodiesterase